MPIAITWLELGRVVYQRLYGVLSVEDARALQVESTYYMNNAIPPLHYVIDMSAVEEFPRSISQFKETLYNASDPRLGWLLIVTSNPILRFMSSVITQLIVPKARLKYFESVPAALDFLTEQDVSLPALHVPPLAPHL